MQRQLINWNGSYMTWHELDSVTEDPNKWWAAEACQAQWAALWRWSHYIRPPPPLPTSGCCPTNLKCWPDYWSPASELCWSKHLVDAWGGAASLIDAKPIFQYPPPCLTTLPHCWWETTRWWLNAGSGSKPSRVQEEPPCQQEVRMDLHLPRGAAQEQEWPYPPTLEVHYVFDSPFELNKPLLWTPLHSGFNLFKIVRWFLSN